MARRLKVVGASIAAAVLLLTGCASNGEEPSGGSSDGGSADTDLIIARAADAQSMDITSIHDNNSIKVGQHIMETLFMITPDGSTVEPWLAESYEISDDNLTYTVKLKEGILFSNGDEMTAEDVKFSIDAATATGDEGWGFVNAPIGEVVVVDDYTVEFKLDQPYAPTLAVLAMFSNGIVPADYDGKSKEEFYSEGPVGTGPFVWREWNPGQSIILDKNPNYWQEGKPAVDSITWSVVPDASTRELMLLGGEIDINEEPDWSSFANLQKQDGVNAELFPSTYMRYMSMNENYEYFADVHVRRAIGYAVDRQAIVDTVTYGNAEIANSIIMKGLPFHDDTLEGIQFDLDKAKEEMAASGFPDGFSTKLLIASGDSEQASIAQIVQASLAEIGITVEITQLDPTANKAARTSMDFEMALMAWYNDIADPDQWTSWALDADASSRAAYTDWRNEEVVALNKAAATETDEDARAELYKELQAIVAEEAYVTMFYYTPYKWAVDDSVEGFHVTPLGNYHLEDVTISE